MRSGQSVSSHMPIKMRGVEVDLIGMQVTVENWAGRLQKVKNVGFCGIPESNFLLQNSDQRSLCMIQGAPHRGIQILPQTLLLR